MTFQQRVEAVGKFHSSLGANVYHYFRTKLSPPYAIWQEDGSDDFNANNTVAEMAVTGTTDYFTKTEYDPMVDTIQFMFRKNGFLWRLNSVQYEEGTGLIHYEWAWVYS